MESDERFKHLALDPRFKNLRKKQRKVQIDDRFKSMFTDEKFTLNYSKDKRGWKQNKSSGDDLRRYYSLDDDSESKTKHSKVGKRKHKLHNKSSQVGEIVERRNEQEAKDDDEESEHDEEVEAEESEDNESEEKGSDTTNESDLSSSSDESESDLEEGDADEIDIRTIEYDWQPLDHDAETGDNTTKRLAIQNLDWDHLDVKDIYTLVHSIRPPLSVRIYVSEFGKERLKQEELEGPKEIVEMPKIDEVEEEYKMLKQKMDAFTNREPRTYKINEYEDADEELDPKNEEIRERIRRYQLSRMKYYYAVVEFDSVESAEIVYKELDGMEYEGSSLELDLRFIPDDVEFEAENLKSECDKVPDLTSYEAPQFINSALQQTTVKFTWDETDVKRQEKLHKAYTKQELEKDDLEAYLASETDEDDEEVDEEEFVDAEESINKSDAVSVVTANSEARVNKYKKLLQSLEEEAEKKKKIDVDVEWGDYEDDENKLNKRESGDSEIDDAEEYEDREFDEEDEIELEEREDKSIERKGRRGKKSKKKNKKRQSDKEENADGADDLDLLVMDVDSKHKGEFKFDPDDPRFEAVYTSGLYNIDPSHPNFKRTEAFDMIAEKKRAKRQKTRS